MAPGLADPGSPAAWLCALANTVAGGRAPTPGNTAAAPPLARSRPPRPARGHAGGLGRGRAEHPLSQRPPQPPAAGEVGLTPHLPSQKLEREGGSVVRPAPSGPVGVVVVGGA